MDAAVSRTPGPLRVKATAGSKSYSLDGNRCDRLVAQRDPEAPNAAGNQDAALRQQQRRCFALSGLMGIAWMRSTSPRYANVWVIDLARQRFWIPPRSAD